MTEKIYQTILETMAKRIQELEFQVMTLEWQLKEADKSTDDEDMPF